MFELGRLWTATSLHAGTTWHRSIIRSAVEVGAASAWAALRLVGEAHKLFAPVLVDGHLEGEIRTVRFANGMVARERIIDVDDERRRVAYSVVDGPGMTYHHASMQIVDAGPGPVSSYGSLISFRPSSAATSCL